MASVDGRAALNTDKVALMWNLYSGSRALANGIRPDVRRDVQAFVHGIYAYYGSHPEDVRRWWRRGQVDEFMVTAFGRRRIKSTWWTPQELAAHIESRTVIRVFIPADSSVR